eukprot:jgi/Orpsp1_1/1183183/evm.model.c7180000084202.1
MPETLNTTVWSVYYNELMNKQFADMVERSGNSKLKNVELNFEFYEYEPMSRTVSSLYFNFINDLYYYWVEEPTYDLFIFDDHFLFSELSYMESDWVEYYLYNRKPCINYLVKLTDYIKTEDLEYNHPRILEDGIGDDDGTKDLYGLPYESDFDVLYYFNDNDKAKSIVKDMKDITWDDVWEKLAPSDPLKIALGDDNDMLNFFVEYTNGIYNMTKEYDNHFYKMLYNDTAESLFTSFRQLVVNYTGGEDRVEDSVYISQDDAYNEFLNKNTTFFKGRASHYHIFEKDEENQSKVSMTLPPKYLSTITEKYLTVSKYSSIDTEILVEAAKILISKEMQLFRAEHFGSIPTFDIGKKDKDEDIQSYCGNHSVLCEWMEKMKRINFKDFFKSRYSSPLYEIEILLPVKFRKRYLMKNEISLMLFVFKNMHELITYDLGIYGVLSCVYTGLISIILFIVIYLVYINRNHPYLKVISPIFCNMIIFGCIIGMLMPLRLLPPYSHFKIRLFSVLKVFGQNLIYIPMFAITYRIYTIFKSKTFLSKKLNNKYLFIGISTVISISVLYRFIVVLVYEHYYYPFGSINSPRYPDEGYTGYQTHDYIHQIYFYIIFICLLFMMITTGSVSKKFGDVCYIFVVFGLNISDFITNKFLQKFSHEHYNVLYLVVIILNGLVYFTCVYTLVGSRLIFVLLYASESTDNKNISSSDLKEFVPLNNDKNRYFSLIKKFKSIVSIGSGNSSNKNSNSSLNVNSKHMALKFQLNH